MTSIRTPLAKVRGLGSAKDGTGHWWHQRLTAVALIPLGIYFVYNMVGLMGAPRTEILAFFASPLHGLLTSLLLVAMFYHGALGLQVVIEDYISKPCCKFTALITVKLGMFAAAAASLMAVWAMHFGTVS